MGLCAGFHKGVYQEHTLDCMHGPCVPSYGTEALSEPPATGASFHPFGYEEGNKTCIRGGSFEEEVIK